MMIIQIALFLNCIPFRRAILCLLASFFQFVQPSKNNINYKKYWQLFFIIDKGCAKISLFVVRRNWFFLSLVMFCLSTLGLPVLLLYLCSIFITLLWYISLPSYLSFSLLPLPLSLPLFLFFSLKTAKIYFFLFPNLPIKTNELVSTHNLSISSQTTKLTYIWQRTLSRQGWRANFTRCQKVDCRTWDISTRGEVYYIACAVVKRL